MPLWKLRSVPERQRWLLRVSMTRAPDARPPARKVSCPACGGVSLYGSENPHRPFCSARCKGLDLGAWASEQFRLPAQVPSEETGEPPLQ